MTVIISSDGAGWPNVKVTTHSIRSRPKSYILNCSEHNIMGMRMSHGPWLLDQLWRFSKFEIWNVFNSVDFGTHIVQVHDYHLVWTWSIDTWLLNWKFHNLEFFFETQVFCRILKQSYSWGMPHATLLNYWNYWNVELFNRSSFENSNCFTSKHVLSSR